ncbi:gamma-butyrobetaine hydroxylase-like domain-containing protein [Lignipirellula cremea]|uniref:Gamma-butyrobetaine hydroxylase-like N-terminal domain-containing protein n=1 Tax=Lignipirellula cremea TaxID=2528010 RepID=A0A518DN25_9BACT|nr:DUF971 domain-containing protein [Lignipirellula cremea]QDU93240.1 hypothetical protein Pla8534_10190 [Lignipirellula cremea]
MINTPTKIERQGDRAICIHWSDGSQREYGVQELRDACPCANCREKNPADGKNVVNPLQVLSESDMRPLTIQGMKPVGTYAYSILFSDAHTSGIYTFELLARLGKAR